MTLSRKRAARTGLTRGPMLPFPQEARSSAIAAPQGGAMTLDTTARSMASGRTFRGPRAVVTRSVARPRWRTLGKAGGRQVAMANQVPAVAVATSSALQPSFSRLRLGYAIETACTGIIILSLVTLALFG